MPSRVSERCPEGLFCFPPGIGEQSARPWELFPERLTEPDLDVSVIGFAGLKAQPLGRFRKSGSFLHHDE
jgi:hypothetical protein